MISVVFATRDRAAMLAPVLERHAALRPAPVPHRLFIVDNGSTDGTAELLREAAAARMPWLTPLREPAPGKNRALNRALPEAAERADLVVFTDDDVLPEPDWLRRLWAAAEAAPGFDVFGGAIRPHWPAPPPRWLFDWGVQFGVVYAATVWQRPGPITADLVWGPNMAVRGAVLRQGHRFDEGVGPDGAATTYGMGSETEFTTRLERAGHRAFFVEDAIVGHMVRPEQMTEAWVLGRAFRHGLGYTRYRPVPHAGRGLAPRWRGMPPGLAWRSAAYRVAARAARALPPGRARFQLLWQAEWLRGVAASCRVAATAAGEQAR